jgi:hypothetical protein
LRGIEGLVVRGGRGINSITDGQQMVESAGEVEEEKDMKL